MKFQKIINTLNECIEQDLSSRFDDEIKSIYKGEYIDFSLYPSEVADMLNKDIDDLEYPINQEINGGIYLNIKYGYDEPEPQTYDYPGSPGGSYVEKCKIKKIIINIPDEEDYGITLNIGNVDLYDLEQTIEIFLIDNYETDE